MSIMNAEQSPNTLKICLFGQTTEQPLQNIDNLEDTSSFIGLALTLVDQLKKCSV